MNELKELDDFLLSKTTAEKALLMEAKLLTSPQFKRELDHLKFVHHLLQVFGRRELRKELTLLHNKVFSDPENASVHRQILSYFQTK